MEIPLVDLKAQYANIREEILEVIDKTLAKAALIAGKSVDDFEKNFAQFCRAEHCVGVASGTDALYLALWALGIGLNDEVILPTHTFIATSGAVRMLGAKPVFVDINEDTFNIDVNKIEEKITERTKAIIPVHIYGLPAELEKITAIAKSYDLKLICDAAQAHSAEYFGRSVTAYGDVSTFSFYPGKNLGAYGDAGAVITNNSETAKRIRQLRDHGRDTKYLHKICGTNARLDNLQAAILNVKLKYLKDWCSKRKTIASWYGERLQMIPGLQLPFVEKKGYLHAMHLYVVKTPSEKRNALLDYLKTKGIGVGIHYPIPLHLQPCNADLNYGKGDFPIAEKICEEILSLPIYPEMNEGHVEYICENIKKFFIK